MKIANSYEQMGNYDQALKYNQRSYNKALEQKDLNKIVVSAMNLGEAHIGKKDYSQALKILTSIQNQVEGLNNYQTRVAFYIFLGKVQYHLGDVKQAEKTLEKSIHLAIKSKLISAETETYIAISEIYIKLGQYQRAEMILNKSEGYLKDWNNRDLELKLVNLKAQLYETLGKFELALQYHKKYMNLYQEAYNQQSSGQIALMQGEFEAERRERELRIQTMELKSHKMTGRLYLLSGVIVLLLMVILFRRYLKIFAFWKQEKYVNHFRIVKEIGTGGMGTIYSAFSNQDKNHTVALKVLKKENLGKEEAVRRFKREARIIDQLDHPNIVKVFERGEYGDKLYIAMELLKGRTLGQIINDNHIVNLRVGLHIMIQLGEVLSFTHQKRVIHRDIKPSNVMIIQRNGDKYFVKLLDFGLAKTKHQTQLTQTGFMVGTLSYTAPELVTGSAKSTNKSDIFALGCVFYEMVTGEQAFSGDLPSEIIRDIMNKIPAEPACVNRYVPETLNNLIMKMLSKDDLSRPSAEVITSVLKTIDISDTPWRNESQKIIHFPESGSTKA